MKPTTRQRILEYFRKHQTATVSELEILFGLTGANMRHHLEVLEDNGLIEVVGKRKESRGRPANIYGFSRRTQGNSLDKLAAALLDCLKDNPGAKNWEIHFMDVAQKLAGSQVEGLPVHKKLLNTIERLNELHYQARWEASAGGARIILGHCPFAAIIHEHPELCHLDALIIESRLELKTRQVEKLQFNDKGLSYCAFLVGGK
jgi:predicted ArsR family transcriptional regulator